MNENPAENQIPVSSSEIKSITHASQKTSNTLLGFILGILFTILLGGGLIILYKDKLNTQPISSPLPVVNVVATPDETANWQLYSNSKYNFSFKYPLGWEIISSPITEDKPDMFDIVVDKLNARKTGFTSIEFSINMANATHLTTISQAEAIYKISKNQIKKNITIDNKSAIVISGVTDDPDPGSRKFRQYIFVQLDNNVLVIQLGNKDYQNDFDQILSTFKFTE
jgi:hypothetical protein